MKKKILITTHTLNIGGVERSFIGLLENLDYDKYEIDVFIYQHHGELFSMLPKKVNLLPEKECYAALFVAPSRVWAKKQFRVILVKFLSHIILKLKSIKFHPDSQKLNSYYHPLYYKVASKILPKISEEKYDVVLAFLHPNFFEANVNAVLRIAWVHSDYSQLNFDKKLELKMWALFNHIACVSELNAESFANEFPSLRKKVLVIENILSLHFVQLQSDLDISAEMPQIADGFNILSVGRFTSPKNFDSIPEIARLLKDKGLLFKWYLIGYGSDEKLIMERITQYAVEENVIILGKKSNPYPYIKACDVYIQPSRFEGKAVTVREAQMLGKPVIITNYPSAQSQVDHGIDGVIVPLDTNHCAEAIWETILNAELLEHLKENVMLRNYSNIDELVKINRVLNGELAFL